MSHDFTAVVRRYEVPPPLCAEGEGGEGGAPAGGPGQAGREPEAGPGGEDPQVGPTGVYSCMCRCMLYRSCICQEARRLNGNEKVKLREGLWRLNLAAYRFLNETGPLLSGGPLAGSCASCFPSFAYTAVSGDHNGVF